MPSRIVKNSEIKADAFKVGQAPVSQKKGLLLKLLEKNYPKADHAEQLKKVEQHIVALGLRQLESKAVEVMDRERKQLQINLKTEIDRILTDISGSMIDLVMDISTKLCRKKMSEDQSIVQEWIKEALSRLGQEKVATLRLNPSDAVVIQKMKEEILKSKEGLKELILQHDPEIEPGGFFLSGDTLLIDSTVGTRFRETEQGLKGQHEN